MRLSDHPLLELLVIVAAVVLAAALVVWAISPIYDVQQPR